MIPHRIIQSHMNPDIDADLRRTWQDLHPDFDYQFFTNVQQREFVAQYRPDALNAFDRLPLPVMRADLFRYIAIHTLGGIYADADTICTTPVWKYIDLKDSSLILGAATEFTDIPRYFTQWMFAASEGNTNLERLIQRCIHDIDALSDGELARGVHEDIFTLNLTGPNQFARALAVDTWSSNVRVLPREYWGCQREELDIVRYQALIKVKHLFKNCWTTSQRRIT